MGFTIQRLSKDFMESRVADFIRISNENIVGDYWQRDHFLSELPRKWELSSVIMDAQDAVVGFLIASEKEATVHIHKFAIDSKVQGFGLGTKLLSDLENKINKPISLKVDRKNDQAIQFYQGKGFVISQRSETLFTMIRQ